MNKNLESQIIRALNCYIKKNISDITFVRGIGTMNVINCVLTDNSVITENSNGNTPISDSPTIHHYYISSEYSIDVEESGGVISQNSTSTGGQTLSLEVDIEVSYAKENEQHYSSRPIDEYSIKVVCLSNQKIIL